MTPRRPRADAARNREAVLAAADALFDDTGDWASVSMESVARAAGVGKATVFRAFGDRTGLLRAVMSHRSAALMAAIQAEEAPFEPGGPVAERVVTLLDALLTFKLENRQLSLALDSEGPSSPYLAENYTWWHNLMTQVLGADFPEADAAFAAHALLAAARSDLIEHQLAVERLSEAEIRDRLLAYAERVVGT